MSTLWRAVLILSLFFSISCKTGETPGRTAQANKVVPTSDSIPMKIDQATYRFYNFAEPNHPTCDAKPKVASLCDGKSTCRFEVNNSLCGLILPGLMKAVDVTYTCGNAKKTGTDREFMLLELSCGPSQLKMLPSPEVRTDGASNRDCSSDKAITLKAVLPPFAKIVNVQGYARNRTDDYKPCRGDGLCYVDYARFCGSWTTSPSSIETVVEWKFVNSSRNIDRYAQIFVQFTL
jgi:hypothetical protein